MYKEFSFTIVSDFNNDLPGALNLIYSIKKNTDIKIVNIITNDSGKSKIEPIKNLTNKLSLDLRIHTLNDEIINKINKKTNVENYKSLKHISSMAYAKFMIPNLIPEKTIYLDTDTLIIRKIKSKFVNLLDDEIYVVRNGEHSPSYWLKRYEGIYETKEEVKKKAFNSGVIFFFNERNKSSNDITSLLINSLEKNDFTYLDQSHFNFVLKNKVQHLSIKYNFPVHNMENKIVKKEKKPKIIHFASKNKPWTKTKIENGFEKIWIDYWNHTSNLINFDI